MDMELVPMHVPPRPRGPRPPPHSRNLFYRSLLVSLSDELDTTSGRQSLLRVLGLPPDLHPILDSNSSNQIRMQRATSSAWPAQSWKLRYTDNASFELDLDFRSRVHMEREGGERRVTFLVADGEEDGRAASEQAANGQLRETGSTPQVTSATDVPSEEAMAVDTTGDPTAAATLNGQEDTMSVSSHSSMPELIPMTASSFNQGSTGDDDFLELFDLYTDDTYEREPVTAEEIYASRLFADDEILLDPVEEERIRAIWAEVDRIRMPLPSLDGSTESSWNSDDELKDIADSARSRREFPNVYLPDLSAHMYPPSDSDGTDWEDELESGEDSNLDAVIARVTGLNSVEEYDDLQRDFQDELAARDMARGSNAWYTPLPLESPGAGLSANADGETLLDMQSFLNLESPGIELMYTGRGQ